MRQKVHFISGNVITGRSVMSYIPRRFESVKLPGEDTKRSVLGVTTNVADDTIEVSISGNPQIEGYSSCRSGYSHNGFFNDLFELFKIMKAVVLSL